jgi:hypothetical protein
MRQNGCHGRKDALEGAEASVISYKDESENIKSPEESVTAVIVKCYNFGWKVRLEMHFQDAVEQRENCPSTYLSPVHV